MRNRTITHAGLSALAIIALAAGLLAGCSGREESPSMSAEQFQAAEMSPEHQTATFGAGCFWGVEHAFRQVEGVVATSVGFSGGRTENPTYKEVCYTDTGHAEVVQVVFDPKQVGYEKLLEVFFSIHDPTQVNRQGPDVGDQYRSAIFYHDDAQREAAEQAKAKLAEQSSRPIATEITPFAAFYRAEEYHQNYYAKHGQTGCAATIRN